MPDAINTNPAIEIIAAEGENKLPRIKGVAYTGGPMRLQGFYHPVIIDLESMMKPAANLPMLRDHDTQRVAGHYEQVDVSQQRIYCEGPLSGIPAHTQELVHTSANGFKWQMSVGANAKYQYVDKGETVKVNGRNQTGPLYIARNAQLREISVLSLGADGATAASVAAHLFGGFEVNEFQKWLAARGHDESKLNDDQKSLLKATFDAEQKIVPNPTPAPVPEVKAGNPPVAPPVAQVVPSVVVPTIDMQAFREQQATEMRRSSGITRIVAQFGVTKATVDGVEVPDLAAHAVEKNMSVDQVELVCRRQGRPVGPHMHVPSAPEANNNVLEAAILQAGGYFRDDPTGSKQKTYGDQTLQAAHSLFRGGIGLQQVVTMAARARGYQGPDRIRDDNDIAACFHHAIRAGYNYGNDMNASSGFSTADLSNVLANVMNKFLLEGYMHVNQAWRKIAAIRPVKDFKPTKSINLLADLVYEEVGASGELKHGTVSDEAYANQAKTYGRMLAITRQHIIDDDLSALTQLPKLLGRGSALKLNKVFWTLFLADTAIFPTANTNNNYVSGAATNLSIAGLTSAIEAFANQKDPKNEILGIEPAILLVPTGLAGTALELFKGTGIVYGGASASKQPDANIYQGRFDPVVSPYINSTYGTVTSTQWWLLADPRDLALIEACFLSGNEVPTVQTAEASFNTLGIQMRGFFDFGVAFQNYRAGVKVKGAA